MKDWNAGFEEDIFEMPLDDLYSKMVKKGNGGTTVHSMAAPALSTQFVKSQYNNKAQAGVEGSFAVINYAALRDRVSKVTRKHENKEPFGYTLNHDSDAFHGGYGERSARALTREETTYQLKGTFPAACLAFAKLKARVIARGGDVAAADKFFAMAWGLSTDCVTSLPTLHVAGSEATRLAAMEDRAYHALSGHPSITGGFRVDTATLAPDSLGEDVPLNWPRLRTGLKAIATVQLQGDLELSSLLQSHLVGRELSIGFDIVRHSQKQYHRPYQWELIFETWVDESRKALGLHTEALNLADVRKAMQVSLQQAWTFELVEEVGPEAYVAMNRISGMVHEDSTRALVKTIDAILQYDRDRALLIDGIEDDAEAIAEGQLATQFTIPRYKVTRGSFRSGLTYERLGPDGLPDVTSHGDARLMLNVDEFRAARLEIPADITGILNLAAYMVTLHSQLRSYAYLLMHRVKPRDPDDTRPVSQSLRHPDLYAGDEVRELGVHLFSSFFIDTLSILFANATSTAKLKDEDIKTKVWNYLRARCGHTRRCPVPGGWRDLIAELRTLPEGWSLYYWVRISIGKKHKVMTSGILAPISTGRSADFLDVIKRSTRERIAYWASYYSAKYLDIERCISKSIKQPDDPSLDPEERKFARYVPPHLRTRVELEILHDSDVKPTGGYQEDEYKMMVEMQSKSKFFSQMRVYTVDRRVIVGFSDDQIREMFIEFYQARWFSLEKRIQKAQKQGRTFHLGPHEFDSHPWGELMTEFPYSLTDLLDTFSHIDRRAWTIPPAYLLGKFQKSARELWNDVIEEITLTMSYIDEVHTDIAEAQEIALEAANVSNVMTATQGIPPIILAVPGYRPMQSLPDRNIEISTKRGPMEVFTRVEPLDTLDDGLEDEGLDDDGFGDDDDDEEAFGILSSVTGKVDFECEIAVYRTFREIWEILGLPEVSDTRMKIAYGMSADASLDDQNLTGELGPVVIQGEENKAIRAWSNKVKFILGRLNVVMDNPAIDDM
jgi:hypothetical protein